MAFSGTMAYVAHGVSGGLQVIDVLGPDPPGGRTADLDDSGNVAFADLTQLLSAGGACAASCAEDLNGDGTVAFADLTELLNRWGPC